jgi:hypothetical protein
MGKRQHGRRTQQAKTRVFAICDAPYVSTNFKQDGKQKLLHSPSAARIGFP